MPTETPKPVAEIRRFAIVQTVVVVAFAGPLLALLRFAWSSSLYSHILLIPFVSLWLAWCERKRLGLAEKRLHTALSLLPAAGAAGLIVWFSLAHTQHWSATDRLAATTSAFVMLTFAAAMASLSWRSLRSLFFPLLLLVFLIPLPDQLTTAIETFLQHGSAAAAQGFFTLTGTPFILDDLTFDLPGIALRVAPECSGIHSTLVLFITSVLAAQLFLRSRVKKALLVGFVIPLALVRNGLRIFVIGELCVRIGPEMIESAVHRRGGPLFFALSLIPLGLLLYVFVRMERNTKRDPATKVQSQTIAQSSQ